MPSTPLKHLASICVLVGKKLQSTSEKLQISVYNVGMLPNAIIGLIYCDRFYDFEMQFFRFVRVLKMESTQGLDHNL
jgi:hypothetical protein